MIEPWKEADNTLTSHCFCLLEQYSFLDSSRVKKLSKHTEMFASLPANAAGLLQEAVVNNNLESVKQLLAQGVAVNSTPSEGRTWDSEGRVNGTALHTAVSVATFGKRPNIEVIKTLIEAGANPLLKNKQGRTAIELNQAILAKPSLCIEEILQSSPHMNTRSAEKPPKDTGLLQVAADKGDLPMVQKLLAEGARVDFTPMWDMAFDPRECFNGTPLHKAVGISRYTNREPNIEVVKALIEAGANPLLKDETGQNAIDINTASEHDKKIEIGEVLLSSRHVKATA